LVIASPWITAKLPKGLPYFYIITFQLIGLLFYETVSWYLRIVHLNKAFSYLQIQQGIGMFVGNVLAAYFFGAMGFAISTVIIPFVLALFWMKKINFFAVQPKYLVKDTTKRAYFNYGFFTSLGGIAAQLLFTVDILVISYLLADAESIAFYKASSMIPFALLFIPTGFILTDFVTLVKESKNKEYLVNYYKNFAKLFFTLSTLLLIVMWLFSDEIMQLFGAKYSNEISLLPIFAFGLIGGMSIRIPMGNLLSAVGWARINALFSAILLILNVILNYYLVKSYGIVGAAWATSGLMWFSGIISFIAFKIYLKKL
jgi:O-antigen/teichoic acid export membrane protein